MSKSDEVKKTVKIENVVASTAIGHEIDLKSLNSVLVGSDYDPEKFPGLVYRTRQPATAILIFHSGKIVCTGAKSIGDVRLGLDKLYTKLDEAGIKVVGKQGVTVQNMVASADLASALNLNAVAIGMGLENIEYEPEQFPGLVCHIDAPKVVLLLFGSGKMVIAGGKKPEDAEAAVDRIVRKLEGLALI